MYKGVKVALDVTFSLIGTAVSSPILLAVAAAVKLDSKGPVIFKQERLGKDGKVFEMYKFRSMCVGAEHMGTGQYSYKGDSRVTRVGKIIRATSLDELPQFINILKGDMSFTVRARRSHIIRGSSKNIPIFSADALKCARE